MKDIFDVSLLDLTPHNLILDKTISKIIQAIDPELTLLSKDIQANLLLPGIEALDEKSLDLLAWQFHADFYDLAGNIKMKREAVKNSLIWHMKKGTEWAIHEALRQLGISAKFHAWWETGGDPYTFTLDAIVTDDYYRTAPGNKITENIRRAVDEAKSARSYLAGLTTKIEFCENVDIRPANFDLLSGHYRVFPEKPRIPDDTKILYANADAIQGWLKILPEKPFVPENNILVGAAIFHSIHAEFGVDLTIMHELLIMFEKRIFDRLDEQENNLRLELDLKHKEIKAEIDDLKELLRWRNY